MDMPGWLDVVGGLVDRTAGFWVRLGGLESNIHRDEIDAVAIDRPVWIAGLARSGSTVLLELLASAPGAATHRYRDFPPVFTPLFWNRAFAHVYRSDAPPAERAHKDRILVTPDSPEAMEEVLWMRFFANRHETETSQVLDAASSNPTFEQFYRDHIRKLLLLRQGRRYLAKANYNITRLAYLAKLFPDARFVVPIREPAAHVASLMKQHRLFCELESKDPRVRRHMRRAGHFEFGLDRRPVNAGNTARAKSVAELWHRGEEARGLARQWRSVYGFLAQQLEEEPEVRDRTLVVRYEDLCARSEETLGEIFRHTQLELPPEGLATLARRLSPPTYYAPSFSEAETVAIHEETDEVAAAFGYRSGAPST